MDYYKKSLEIHEKYKGKWAMHSKISLSTKEDLSVLYTPGVAEPCKAIKKNKDEVYRYTSKQNTVAVITDGTAVLGLGDIGSKAAIPVMEGKAILFKEFADVDAVPICVDTKDVNEFVFIVKNIAATFGGVNLEDISAPRCFEIEKLLQESLDIPVFHDDQHGTAIVTAAALINSLKITNKNLKEVKIVVSGAGAAGTAIVKMLISLGATDIIVSDVKGILCAEGGGDEEIHRKALAELTNKNGIKGTLEEAVKDRDVFIGVSAPNILTGEMVKTMASDPIIFAMANPEPEINPEIAFKNGARVVGTGRSDNPNQINNVLVFPGLFRGALDARATKITEKMKIAAVYALANYIQENELSIKKIIPDPLDKGVSKVLAEAVANAWESETNKC